MIYYVTLKPELYKAEEYEIISPEKSLELLGPLKNVGCDTETEGLDPHTKKLLSLQLGCKDFQVVIDCTTIDVRLYKEYLESDRLFILWNATFDLKFLYHYDIIIKNVYDGMIAEILLWLGYPAGMHSMSLANATFSYLGISLDKTVRGKIITQGLNTETIVYSARDVQYLEDVMNAQRVELDEQNLYQAAIFDSKYTLVNAYFEYCGAKLDPDKWKVKMDKDKEELIKARKVLDQYVVDWEEKNLKEKSRIVYIDTYIGRGINVIEKEKESIRGAKRRPDLDYEYNEAYEIHTTRLYTKIDTQGDLFTGFDLTPKCTINWDSSKQVIPLFEEIGINCTVIDKKTKTKKKSVLAKVIQPQEHKFPIISLYLNYKAQATQVNSFGLKFLKYINPKTGRIHSNFKSIGTDTGRTTSNEPNLAQIPRNSYTRSCFVAEKGNKWASCDYAG